MKLASVDVDTNSESNHIDISVTLHQNHTDVSVIDVSVMSVKPFDLD